MGEIDSYKESCEYLKKRFKLTDFDSLYKIVTVATDFIRTVDEEKELVKLQSEENKSLKGEEKCLTKESKKKSKTQSK